MATTPAAQGWLPELCTLPRLTIILGLAELVVVVLALAPDRTGKWSVEHFASISAFALWQAIAATALLCLLRPQLSRLPPRLGAVAALALAGAVGLLSASALFVLYSTIGLPEGAPAVGFWRFSLSSAAMVMLIGALALRYFYVSDRWAAQVQASARAEADALQARIRPHFLFNSMNLIAGLLHSAPQVAERAVLDLSDLFRAALGAGEDNSTLAQEVELAEQYLSIESLRLGERLTVRWERTEPLPWDLVLPRLVLQPMVENAVLHGISRLPQGGTIDIALAVEHKTLRIIVRNPAPEPGSVPVPAVGRGAGHAQRNIAHRLAYRFGAGARVTGFWAQGYYACELALPLA
ncbi:sensor histidine kinase [Pseudoxanthomonas winnipegensis]|uniref:sensor histidine kinase n=1 Tax=Pseudoxanthomonas winnipegensis TaxID=2480810 RepID=UPI0030F44C95